MVDNGVYSILFSSSSKVYGIPQYLPLDEKHPTGDCTNPYGRTKYMVEQILQDLAAADKVLAFQGQVRKNFQRYYFCFSPNQT